MNIQNRKRASVKNTDALFKIDFDVFWVYGYSKELYCYLTTFYERDKK